jgi:hypothetical protein
MRGNRSGHGYCWDQLCYQDSNVITEYKTMGALHICRFVQSAPSSQHSQHRVVHHQRHIRHLHFSCTLIDCRPNHCLTIPTIVTMAGRFFTAAVLFAAAFASNNSTASNSDNSTASTFSYDVPADEVANTPASDDYGT